MSVLRITDFKGELRARHPRLLPPGFAQRANSVDFKRGSIEPLFSDVVVETDIPENTRFAILQDGDWLTYTDRIHAVPGPVATDRLYITTDALGSPKMRVGSNEYFLALFGSNTGPVITHSTTPASGLPTVRYVYTYVTQFDEESPPSPLSDAEPFGPDHNNVVGLFAAPDPSRGINRIRIYRTQTSAAGVTDLYFVGEVPLTADPFSQTFTDTFNTPIQEVLPSNDYDAPPDGMVGIAGMANGMMVAFQGRELLFSEPYKPHAWPRKYRLTTEYEIVAVVGFRSNVAVLTKGTPYLCFAPHPSEAVLTQMEVMLPCLSPYGAVSLGYGVAYPSADGLVVLTPGDAQVTAPSDNLVVTRQMFTRRQWAKFDPSSIRAAFMDGKYIFSYNPVNDNINDVDRLGIIDLTGNSPWFVSVDDSNVFYHNFWSDPTTSDVYAVKSGVSFLTRIERILQGDTPRLDATWRSQTLVMPAPTNFGAMLVEGEAVDDVESVFVSASIHANGEQVHSEVGLTLNEPFRLPSGFLAREWIIELYDISAAITSVSIAHTMEDLAG